MATVTQMIEWLNTLPQDAEVECGVEVTKNYNTWMSMRPVEIDACDVFDYTSEQDRQQYPNMAGKIVVQLRSV